MPVFVALKGHWMRRALARPGCRSVVDAGGEEWLVYPTDLGPDAASREAQAALQGAPGNGELCAYAVLTCAAQDLPRCLAADGPWLHVAGSACAAEFAPEPEGEGPPGFV